MGLLRNLCTFICCRPCFTVYIHFPIHESSLFADFQMKIACLVLAACAFAAATPAINEARPTSNRPGRFLSLPNPQKCANSEYLIWLSRDTRIIDEYRSRVAFFPAGEISPARRPRFRDFRARPKRTCAKLFCLLPTLFDNYNVSDVLLRGRW